MENYSRERDCVFKIECKPTTGTNQVHTNMTSFSYKFRSLPLLGLCFENIAQVTKGCIFLSHIS